MKKIPHSLFAALLAAGTALLCGCEAFEETFDMNMPDYQPKFVLTLNQIVQYPRGSDLENTVTNFAGEKLVVNTNQFFSSAYIRDVRLLPIEDKPGFYDLSLQLSQKGILAWYQLCIDFRSEPMAILIDQVYFGKFTPATIIDEKTEWVTLTGPFNEPTALGIQQFARKNYRHFSPSASSLF